MERHSHALLRKQVVLTRVVVLSRKFGGYILHLSKHGRLLEATHHLLGNESGMVNLRRVVPHVQVSRMDHGRIGQWRHLPILKRHVLARVGGELRLGVDPPLQLEFAQVVHRNFGLILVHLVVLGQVDDD